MVSHASLTTHQLHHPEWSPHLSKLHFLLLSDADRYASSRGGAKGVVVVRLNEIMFAELLAQCLAYSKCSINDISYSIYCN